MDKNLLATTGWYDEAESLNFIEEFYDAVVHVFVDCGKII
jgi:hypothetical protein